MVLPPIQQVGLETFIAYVVLPRPTEEVRLEFLPNGREKSWNGTGPSEKGKELWP